eukprot:symbB.v1.2.032899.t1/scaffold4016.1/size46338/1
MPGALRKARRQVLYVDCRLLQAYNATHLMREDMRHFVYETVIGPVRILDSFMIRVLATSGSEVEALAVIRAVQALASALRINRALTQLRLHGNDVGVQGVQALASALMVNRVVAADWNQAMLDAVVLADALRVNTTITQLGLYYDNPIGDKGVKALAAALEANKTIEFVRLDDDAIKQLTDEGKQAWNRIEDICEERRRERFRAERERALAERERARAEREMQESP